MNQQVLRIRADELRVEDQIFTCTSDFSSTIKGKLIKNPINLGGGYVKLELVDDIPSSNIKYGSVINLFKKNHTTITVLSRRYVS